VLQRAGNGFQNVGRAEALISEHLGVRLFEGIERKEVEECGTTFEKRHPITHNLGVVDQRFLERMSSQERLGREARVEAQEVLSAVNFVEQLVGSLYERVFQARARPGA